MIEKINSRIHISESVSPNSQTVRAETQRRWHTDQSNLTTIVPTLPQSWRYTVGQDFNGAQVEVPTVNMDIVLTHKLRSRPTDQPGKIAVKPDTHTPNLDVNPHQWLLMNNPRLASVVTAAIGDRWIAHLEDLQQLAPIADDPDFQSQWHAVKQANKQALADDLYQAQGVKINVDSLFDLQLQPIDGHQRQLLNILHIITLYHRIKENPQRDILPRTFIFGDTDELESAAFVPDRHSETMVPPNGLPSAPAIDDTAAPIENQTISILIASLAETLAADPDVRGRLQVVYIPRSAGLTNQMCCAADLTEQIATAGMEDVDLSQLKLSVNGALSIASMGKANHLLQQAVGPDNCFSFGLAIPEIALFKEYGYDPYNYYKYYPEIRQAIDSLMSGLFTSRYPGICRSLVNMLLDTDEHMVLADYVFYRACQARVSEIYLQASLWTRMSILNVAGVG
jgi:glycogen phosphorylase